MSPQPVNHKQYPIAKSPNFLNPSLRFGNNHCGRSLALCAPRRRFRAIAFNSNEGLRVQLQVIVTERAGHAYDAMSTIVNKELMSYDRVIAVSDDGFFNEILNGFLSSRDKAPYPPTPSDFLDSASCNESHCE